MKKIFMISHQLNSFRWIGLPEDDSSGVALAKIKFEPIPEGLRNLKIEWLPETISRELCDFPKFRHPFLCFSKVAFELLSPLILLDGEFIELHGVEVDYRAFNCLKVCDALNFELVNEMKRMDEFYSIYSPEKTPPLVAERVCESNIFRIEGLKNKFFVTDVFKKIYDDNGFTGLAFHYVDLT